MDTLNGVLHGAPVEDSNVILADFNPYAGSDGDTLRDVTERNGLPDLNPSWWVIWGGKPLDRPGKPKHVVRVNWECLEEGPVLLFWHPCGG